MQAGFRNTKQELTVRLQETAGNATANLLTECPGEKWGSSREFSSRK